MYVFIEYCKGMKVYMFMCFETNKIIRNKIVVFMENNANIQNYLEMHPSGKMKALWWWWRWTNILNLFFMA